MGFNNPIIGGGGALVYPSIHSPDYVPGVSGWSINKDGSAEFNSIISIGPISVEDGDGDTLASIDSNGNVTGQTINGVVDVVLAGTSLDTLLSGLIDPDPWHQMTLLNGAVSGSAGNAYPSYRMSDTENIVYIGGVVEITTNTVFATLPSGYFDPNTQTQFPISATAPANISNEPYLQCDSSGNLKIINAAGGGAVNTCIIDGALYVDIPNATVTGGGSGSGNKQTSTITTTPTTYSYEGTNGDSSPNPGFTPGALINTNGNGYQGDDQLGDNGNCSTFMVFSGGLVTALSGATINWVKLTLHNLHSWNNSGISYSIGYTTATPGGGSRPTITNPAIATGLTSPEGASHTYQISNVSSAFGAALAAGDSLVLYNPSSTRNCYGYVKGGSGITLQVNITK